MSKGKIWIGCDPGLSGYFALLNDDGSIIATRKMPLDANRKFSAIETWGLIKAIHEWSKGNIYCCIEGLLSLPSDANQVKTLLDYYVKYPTDDNLTAVHKQLKRCDGRLGTKTMSVNWGILIGQFAAVNWPVTIVSPRSWQSQMHSTATGKLTTKQRSYEVCRQLWPDYNYKGSKRKGFDDNLCDALLIAEYLRRKLK